MKYGFIDIPTIYFFEEKNIFTGSCMEDLSFRIAARKLDDDSTELFCAVWEGKKNFELIDPGSYKYEFHEAFTQEGVDAIGNKLLEAAQAYAKNGYRFDS